jgi:hypothetical protein
MSKLYVGVIAFDDHKDKLESRMTNPASFSVIADWMQSVIEFHGAELKYNPECVWEEIRVMVYENGPELYTVKAEAIDTVVMRNPYRG